MFEILFFFIGVTNNILLMFVFMFRKAGNEKAMKNTGYVYFFLAIPAILAIIIAAIQGKAANYIIFLVIFLAYLTLEYLFDFLLKIPFRKNL